MGAPSTNFLQHNPNATNQETDATYIADSIRTAGLTTGDLVPSPWLNKILFQVSTFVAAFAAMLVAKGISTFDTSLSALVTALMAIVTTADWTKGNNAYGYWEKSPSGKIEQWGVANLGTDPQTIIFPTPFTQLASIAVVMSPINYGTGATRNVVYQPSAPTLTQFTGQTDSSSAAFHWRATGY